ELGDPSPVIAQATAAGVTRMIAMGVNQETNAKAVELAQAHPQVWAGAGHYPLDASAFDVDAVRSLALNPRVAAIGEIGLDFQDAGEVGRPQQLERFEALLALAVEHDLPVSIHNRGAEADVEAAIKRHPGLRGVMHYFALGWDWAERFLALDLYLSFAGLVTRPSRHALREVAARCPADRLLLETDSPYGNAHRRMNEPNRPAYLLDTAELVAELRGVTIEELGAQETRNALELFGRMS
ncbi:MAG TPA: TatD family hydrolase, partial [Patescibacteria group bacterium]|nr:TatD family hydrolase [Patescibacteria group bacterium]